jgi:hypothetical protein
MKRPTKSAAGRGPSASELFNEEFHTLLREAAEKREGRALIHSTEDTTAARQESADLLALARESTGSRPAEF